MTPFGKGAPDSDYLRNPYPALDRLREESPRHYVSTHNAWFFSTRRDIEILLRDDRLKITRSSSFSDNSPKFRAAVSHALRIWFASSPPTIRDAVDCVVAQCVSRLATRAEANLVTEAAQYVPSHIMAHLLGIPLSDLPPLQRLGDEVLNSYDLDWEGRDKRQLAHASLPLYFKNHWRSAPNTPLLRMLRELQGENGLPDESMTDVCSKLFTAGTTTTAACIANIFARLVGTVGDENIAITSENVENLLRADTPILAIKRIVNEAVQLDGIVLQPGQTVFLMIASANRGLDPLRQGASSTLTFGLGRYYCIGAALARLELRTLIQKIAPLESRLTLAAPILWRDSWLVHEARSISVTINEAKHAD